MLSIPFTTWRSQGMIYTIKILELVAYSLIAKSSKCLNLVVSNLIWEHFWENFSTEFPEWKYGLWQCATSPFNAKIKCPIEGIKVSVTVECRITNTLAGRHTWTWLNGSHWNSERVQRRSATATNRANNNSPNCMEQHLHSGRFYWGVGDRRLVGWRI